MAVSLNVHGLWPFAVGLVGFALAVVVYRARPDRWQNRFAAAALALEPWLISFGVGWIHLLEDPGSVYGLAFASMLAGPAFQAAYLGFLATLDTPLSRPLRHPAARVVVGLYVVAFWAAVVAWPDAVVTAVVPGDGTPWHPVYGPLVTALRLSFLAFFVYALAAAVSAWRRAEPGSPVSERNRWFAVAFGTRDVGVFGLLSVAVFAMPRVSDPSALDAVLEVLFPIPALLGFLLIAYGILKVQLFDIDLKIKWTLEKSTIVAAFGAIFVVVSEGIEVLLGVEGTLYGLVGAVAIGVFFQRLERGAEAVADRLMPEVEDTEAYRRDRKLEVYRGTLQDAVQDGELSDRDREILASVRERLGIDDEAAERVERDLVATGGPR